LHAHVPLVGFHVAFVGHVQIDVAPGALLSVKRTPGDGPETVQHGCTTLRLLDSPVYAVRTHVGASLVPSFTPVETTIVDPVLKTACEPSPLPRTLNSAWFQPVTSRSSLGIATAFRSPPCRENRMESESPARATSTAPSKFAAETLGTSLAGLLTAQSPLPSGVHPVGHVGPYASRKYSMNIVPGTPVPPTPIKNCCQPLQADGVTAPLHAGVGKGFVLSCNMSALGTLRMPPSRVLNKLPSVVTPVTLRNAPVALDIG
jgi:hypothetical protein